jgi:hypothetical protein
MTGWIGGTSENPIIFTFRAHHLHPLKQAEQESFTSFERHNTSSRDSTLSEFQDNTDPSDSPIKKSTLSEDNDYLERKSP